MTRSQGLDQERVDAVVTLKKALDNVPPSRSRAAASVVDLPGAGRSSLTAPTPLRSALAHHLRQGCREKTMTERLTNEIPDAQRPARG
jgi:ribosomal protein S7